ncbi:hypothetical protein NHX12_019153 [Muraenolepis orangiensis]|uniref:Uncharacterized protein n=1 Tax=Muraenolepis orangiensis TaxID=630683 RepID=A0A9Q0IX90_9TELE|nr:hypothetical protein NHX12_019153 [Muraenolepis orangiensis]
MKQFPDKYEVLRDTLSRPDALRDWTRLISASSSGTPLGPSLEGMVCSDVARMCLDLGGEAEEGGCCGGGGVHGGVPGSLRAMMQAC